MMQAGNNFYRNLERIQIREVKSAKKEGGVRDAEKLSQNFTTRFVLSVYINLLSSRIGAASKVDTN